MTRASLRAVRRKLQNLIVGIVVAIGLNMSSVQAQQELPLEVQVDLALIELERAVGSGDHASVLEVIDRIRGLSPASGEGEVLFFEAEAAMGADDFDRAEAALTKFVSSVGPGSELYPAALEMLLDLTGLIANESRAAAALADCEAAADRETIFAPSLVPEAAEVAVSICRQASELDPQSGRAGVLLGNSLGFAGRHNEAVEAYRAAAERGYASAMVYLGMAYRGGVVQQDDLEAARWYERAADLGDTSGMVYLGQMYANASGVQRNTPAAIDLFMRAASAGDPNGYYLLANLYLFPGAESGMEADPDMAVTYLLAAVEQGDGSSMLELGRVYRSSKHGLQNFAEAMRWYREAADAGAYGANLALAEMHEAGEGVLRDHVLAAEFLLKNERSDFRYDFNILRRPPETMREVQRLLREAGFYAGEIDGNYNAETRRALDAYVAAD